MLRERVRDTPPDATVAADPVSRSGQRSDEDSTDGQTFQQRGRRTRQPKGPRGAITFLPDGRTLIQLFEGADLSTLLHESGHLLLEMTRRLAAAPDASEGLKRDWRTLTAWIGVAPDGTLETAHHERFAEGFERNLLEGKAPSLELQSAFDRFRRWLADVYRRLRGLSVELTPEVRKVMDRRLATDAAIAEAEAASRFSPLLDTPEKAAAVGMSEAERKAYLAAAERATMEATRQVERQAMERIRKERSAEWQAAEAQTRAEVERASSTRRGGRSTPRPALVPRMGSVPRGPTRLARPSAGKATSLAGHRPFGIACGA